MDQRLFSQLSIRYVEGQILIAVSLDTHSVRILSRKAVGCEVDKLIFATICFVSGKLIRICVVPERRRDLCTSNVIDLYRSDCR